MAATGTPQQRPSNNYRQHDAIESRLPYSEQPADRWTGAATGPARDRFSNTDHKRDRFDNYARIPQVSAYHRDRDHVSRPLDKRK